MTDAGVDVTALRAQADTLRRERYVPAGRWYLGLDEVFGEVKPANELALVDHLKREEHVVAMAGDGINDVPALAKADVWIAMGTGTDVTMYSTQVTLVNGDLNGIARPGALSVATIANIKQNLLSPMIAALAMSLSSVSVIFNALRLKSVRL